MATLCAWQVAFGRGAALGREYIFDALRSLRHTQRVWVGTLDVKKYFANIDHALLLDILHHRIHDKALLGLCQEIIKSFGTGGRGLPLGNLTSQWFANIYLHELDWFAKHTLRIKKYMRYNDDIMVIGRRENEVHAWIAALRVYAARELLLEIPDHKVLVSALPQPIDILGLCTNGDRQWLRYTTRRRAEKNVARAVAQNSPRLLDHICSYDAIGARGIFDLYLDSN